MKIIGADARLAEKRGAKILIVGPAGVGKTSLLRTLDRSARCSSTRKPGTWPCRTYRSTRYVSTTGRPRATSHVGSAVQTYRFRRPPLLGGALFELRRRARESRPYKTIFVDSITAISRLSFRHAEQQPEAHSLAAQKIPAARTGFMRAKC